MDLMNKWLILIANENRYYKPNEIACWKFVIEIQKVNYNIGSTNHLPIYQ